MQNSDTENWNSFTHKLELLSKHFESEHKVKRDEPLIKNKKEFIVEILLT